MIPTHDWLFKKENNIMVGTSYLHLLRNIHFQEILKVVTQSEGVSRKNVEDILNYLMISSYNAGSSRIKQVLTKNGISNLAQINKVKSEHLLNLLTSKAPLETRDYLKRVLKHKDRFKQIIK